MAMRCLLLSKGTTLSNYARTLATLPEISHKSKDIQKIKRSCESEQISTMAIKTSVRERSSSPERQNDQGVSKRRKAFKGLSSFIFGSRQNQDLQRFLQEVGTDPREARYWLRQFQSSTETPKTFAVIEIDEKVFDNFDMLEKLCSSISFLHRHQMRCVIVLGCNLDSKNADSEQFLKLRKKLTQNMLELSSELESQGAMATPLFPGCKLLTAESGDTCSQVICCDDTSLLDWSFQLEHIPIIQSIAENQHGQLIPVDISHTMHTLSAKLQPRKVLFLNTTGGFTDDHGEIVANINLSPANLKMTHEKPWCTGLVRQKIDYVGTIVNALPKESSVVITSAGKLLPELFSHHGSGTFFNITEPIHKYTSLEKVDVDRLLGLLNRSFKMDLREDYFDKLIPRLKALYLSEDYNAAAIVTNEDGCGVPYLDKFAVSMAKQGVGYGDILWDSIQRDFKNLFWRANPQNKINPWYFKRCTGSIRQNNWVVFWYGLEDHTESFKVIETAIHKPISFSPTSSRENNTLVD